MSNQPNLIRYRLPYWQWVVVNGLLLSLFIALFTPATAGLAWYVERRLWGRVPILWLTLSTVWGIVAGMTVGVPEWLSLWHWVLALPAALAAGGVLRGIYRLSRFLRPRTLQEQVTEEQARLERHSSSSLLTASRVPAARPGILRLGPRHKGDALPEHLGLAIDRGWLTLEERLLDQHLFVLGSTGAGKSETIKRLVREIFENTDRHVYLVDGKGDEGLAGDIRALAHRHGRGEAPVFRLGFDRHGAIYDGFRGSAADVYNRLCALVGVNGAEGGAQYYADINRDLLQLICFAGDKPPRSFEEVRRRLSREWLKTAYAHDPEELHTIEEELSAEDIRGLARRIRPLAREFAPCVGPEGFALEETGCAIFSMRVQSVGDTARRFLDFLVEDLKDFVGKRQKHPAVLIIDEFGQFANTNIIALLTLARSSRLGVVLATQDTASLKDEDTKKNVLANTRTKILMATDFPEEVAELAGTVYQVETSVQHEDGEMTGMGSARVQHAFKIDMNEAARLRAGEAFVIRQRHMTRIQVAQAGSAEPVPPQAEQVRTKSSSAHYDSAVTGAIRL